MAVTKEELDSFHRFANTVVDEGEAELSLEQLVIKWRANQRAAVNDAIREGIADMNAGLGRPAGEVMEELSRKHIMP